MTTNSDQLIQELISITERSAAIAKRYKQLGSGALNYKENSGSWSILECIEHLNLYGDFYLPEINKQMDNHHSKPVSHVFKSGFIGDYFAQLMKGKNGEIKKMKTPGNMNSAGSDISVTSIDRFLKQTELLKSLLIRAKEKDLTKIKTHIALTKLIKLRLGDTFRFVVFHIERHISQAERVMAKLPEQQLSVSGNN